MTVGSIVCTPPASHPDICIALLDAGLHVLADLWETWPLGHYAACATPQEVLESKRDSIVAFTAGNVCATRFMQDTANKDEVVAFAAELTEVPEDIVARTYDTFVADEIWPDDHGLPQDMIEFTGQQQVELGAIEEANLPAYEDVVDLSIFEEATALIDEQGGCSAGAYRVGPHPTIVRGTRSGRAPSRNPQLSAPRRRRGTVGPQSAGSGRVSP